jgi:hypothetical protein
MVKKVGDLKLMVIEGEKMRKENAKTHEKKKKDCKDFSLLKSENKHPCS